jgi:hypothetical protein
MQNMEVVLSGIGLVIGVVVAVLSYIAPSLLATPSRVEERPRVTGGFWLALALILVLGLMALLKHPPFSSGQRLGAGYLIGGLLALVGAVLCSRLMNPGRAYWPYPFALAASLALAASSLTLLAFMGDPVEALLGCALGFTVVAGVFRITYTSGRMVDLSRAVEAGAALAITLCAASTRGLYHFHSRDQRGWWAFPMALAGFWLVGQVISYLAVGHRSMERRPAAALLISAGLSAVLMVAMGSVLAEKLEPAHSLFPLLAIGVVTAALVVWLAMAAERETENWQLWLQAAGLAILLTLFLLVVSLKMLSGFGVAVGLLAAWAVVGSALGMGAFAARLPLQALLIGANYLLLELFLARPGLFVGEADLSLQYAIIGVILGVLLPAIYSSLAPEARVGRAFAVGLLGAATPVILLTLWGPDVLLGLMIGLVARQAVGAGFVAMVAASERWGPWQAPTAMLALGMAIVTVQFGHSLSFLYDVPRIYKAYLAGGVALLVVIVVLAVTLPVHMRRATARPASGAAGPRGAT